MSTKGMKQWLCSVVLVALLGPEIKAQEGFFIARYQVGVPTGHFKEYIDRTSWRGFTVGYRWLPDETVTFGLDMGWQGYDLRNEYDTYELGTASVSGVQFRYQNTFQITAQTEYVFNRGGDIRPYAGLGVGGLYIRRLTSFGLFEVEQDPWQFLLKPGLGCSYYMSNGTALLIGVDYLGGFKNAQLESQSNLAFTLGFLFGS